MKKHAHTIMIQGTASSVGKSTLVAGLCRLFAQEGWRVAPFKAQNMALNSFVTRSGGEIGRAQAVQAEAAGIEPTVDMNPILLKPEGNARSQVIVLGRPLATLEARHYFHQRADLLAIVQQALARLLAAYDLIIIEGAGSPVELNLAHYDLVNMHIARLVNAPVLLVGDIDRGGIFASLLGTLLLLPPHDRVRVKGLIVNKFRGDLSLWREGEQILAERSGLPVLGTVPYFDTFSLAEEDSVALEQGTAAVVRPRHTQQQNQLEIVVIRLPYLSNYDEFDALATEPQVHLRFVATLVECTFQPDLVILPGTKNTLFDLAWLWRQGLAQQIRHWAKQGCAILGICGGYQMLGERLSDHIGVEAAAGTIEPGLRLLPVETCFGPLDEKMTLQCQARLNAQARRGLFAHLDTRAFQVYQIHLGRTAATQSDDQAGNSVFHLSTGEIDGWQNTDGWCAGTYVHGLFANETFRRGIVEVLMRRRSLEPVASDHSSFDQQSNYDKLAALLRTHLAIPQLKTVCGLA